MKEQYVKRPSHAWPVDPARYPLSGPSSGPVHLPPEYSYMQNRTMARPLMAVAVWAAIGVVCFAFGGCILVLVVAVALLNRA